MLLKELIRDLQDLYFHEVKANPGSEPEIYVDLFRQSDSSGNFQYSGLSKDINIQSPGNSRRIIISAIEVDDTHISGFGDIEDEVKPKLDFKTEILLLVDYPRVKATIESTWGTIKCRQYIHGLLIDDRPGRQNSKVQGFPKKVYDALTNILSLHDSAYPQYVPRSKLWDIDTLI